MSLLDQHVLSLLWRCWSEQLPNMKLVRFSIKCISSDYWNWQANIMHSANARLTAFIRKKYINEKKKVFIKFFTQFTFLSWCYSSTSVSSGVSNNGNKWVQAIFIPWKHLSCCALSICCTCVVKSMMLCGRCVYLHVFFEVALRWALCSTVTLDWLLWNVAHIRRKHVPNRMNSKWPWHFQHHH